MNRVLAQLAARQILGRRWTIIVMAVMLLPTIIGLIYQLLGDSSGPLDDAEFAVGMSGVLMVGMLVPILALILGTGALGSEIEGGTVVFLLSKPISRQRILAVKITVAVAVAVLVVTPASLAATWIVMGSPTTYGLMFGLTLTAAAGAIIYTVVFVALSAVTHRAIVVGLIYVFVWELFITNLFNGLRWLSIREYADGWAHAFISIPDPDLYDPQLNLVAAIIGSVLVVVIAALIGGRALARFQIGERT